MLLYVTYHQGSMVRLSIGHIGEPYKNGLTDPDIVVSLILKISKIQNIRYAGNLFQNTL